MLKKTALHDTHLKLGAKFVDFAGYSMPIWYSRHRSEHLSVRQSCGMFDISHMGLFLFEGSNLCDTLQKFSCNTLANKNVYTMLLNKEGKILDDVMITPFNKHDYLMVVNASNKSKLMTNFSTFNKDVFSIKDLSTTYSFIAVQGPKSLILLSSVFNYDLTKIPSMTLTELSYSGKRVFLSRTGYTGELGVEIILDHTLAALFWNQCIALGITPCGLAARDTLRLEKGFCLYGHELSEQVTPLETHYSWVVKFDHDFQGKEALISQKSQGIPTKIFPFTCKQRIIPRHGYKIFNAKVCVGEVCSGTLSPSLNQGIGLARIVNRDFDQLHLEIRGEKIEILAHNLPFV